MVHTKSRFLKEHDVKVGLCRYLREKQGQGSKLLLVEEICLGRGRTRADLVAVDAQLRGYEIKSPRDSLTRLPRQLEDYRTVFDQVILVIGLKHLSGILSQIPSWCGILLASSVGQRVIIEEFRGPQQNLDRDRHALAQLLWREEALASLKKYGHATGVLSKPRTVLWKRLADVLATDELSAEVRYAFHRRPPKWRRDFNL